MQRASLVRILGIVAGGVGIVALGAVADRWIVADGGDPISGNLAVIVLVGASGLIASVLVAARNRAVEKAPDEVRAQALGFAPKPGIGQVVVVRNDRMGAKIGAPVAVDGALHTELTSPGFTILELAPGRHRVAVAFQAREAERELDLRAGDVVALHVRMRMGLTETIPSLETVGLEEARRMIGKAPMTLRLADPG